MEIVKADGDTDGNFMSLVDARREGASIGTLATAIETHGVCGWDRFNRLVKWGASEPEAVETLDLLAAALERENGQHYEWHPDDDDPQRNPLLLRGWMQDGCPVLEDIAAGQRERPSDDGGDLRIGGHLLIEVMRRELVALRVEGKKTRRFDSNAQLIDWILREYPEHRGLGDTNMEKVFAAAKKAWVKRFGNAPER